MGDFASSRFCRFRRLISKNALETAFCTSMEVSTLRYSQDIRGATWRACNGWKAPLTARILALVLGRSAQSGFFAAYAFRMWAGTFDPRRIVHSFALRAAVFSDGDAARAVWMSAFCVMRCHLALHSVDVVCRRGVAGWCPEFSGAC
jgi:hypothetical protein